MRLVILFLWSLVTVLGFVRAASCQYLIYEDKMQLEIFRQELQSATKENLITIIKQKEEDPFRRAAAVRVLAEKYLEKLDSLEKKSLEDILRIVFRKGGSSFIRIEIASALCQANRDLYFPDMVPFLIRRLDNENSVVAQLAFTRLNEILNNRKASTKEAGVVLDTAKGVIIRKSDIPQGYPERYFAKELDLIRWAVGILGDNAYAHVPHYIILLLEKRREDSGED